MVITAEDNKLAYALLAADRGWHVFPCHRTDKTPRWKWSESATNDREIIRRWWSSHPYDNIAIACKPSKLVVVDMDVSDVGFDILGKKFRFGVAAFMHIAERIGKELPMTYAVRTAGGGMHMYFNAPDDVTIGNKALLRARGLIDIRAAGGEHGGYVLAAGSTNIDGVQYRSNGANVADLPLWLVRLLRETPLPAKAPRFNQPIKADWLYLGEAIATSLPGQRNSMLHWAATVIAQEGGSVDDATEILIPPFLRTGEHHSEEEALSTILSAFRNTAGRDV